MHFDAAIRRRIFYAVVATLFLSTFGFAAKSSQNPLESPGTAMGSVAATPTAAATEGDIHTEEQTTASSAFDALAPAAAVSKPEQQAVEAAPRPKFTTYTVVEGDNIEAIALRYGLKVTTLLWTNNIDSEDILSIGQELTIPAVDGLVRKVESGDNLWDIAAATGASVEDIVRANPDVDPSLIQPGTVLMIPGAKLELRRMVASRGSARGPARSFANWPAAGPLTDGFGWRVHPVYGARHFHDGIDIGVGSGTAVRAVLGGTVTLAGRLGGYGIVVKIDHGSGIETQYSHLSSVNVESGANVAAGDVVGYSGNTGVSTGPHLHFSLFVNDTPTDPRPWLP